MQNNIFDRNMAYFAGNAFYIRHKMRNLDLYDYLQFCGAGTLIEDNVFENNIGLKRHNGGAGVIRCHRVEDAVDWKEESYFDRNKTSGLFLRERNATEEEIVEWGAKDQEDMNHTFYEDPRETTVNVTDLFDFDDEGLYRTNYTLLRYATYITNNTF